jgi:hypothetical protein
MKKVILLLLILCLSVGSVFALQDLNITSESEDAIEAIGNNAHFRVTEVRQDPFPANPGESVDIYMKIENVGASILGPRFEFNLNYPFELNPVSNLVGKQYSSLDQGDKLTLKYKLNIDGVAKAGDYEVEFRSYSDRNHYFPYFFKISVDQIDTDFEMALQEVTKDGVSLALANTGKNTANSITVSLEDQEDFIVVGPTSYIVGNLNMGDYTLLNIFVEPANKVEVGDKLSLKVKISYTDEEGNRREVEKVLPVIMSYKINQGFVDLDNEVYGKNKQTSTGPSFFFYTTIIIALAWIIVAVYKRRKDRRKNK